MGTLLGRGFAFAHERQQSIARIVEEHGRARVGDLAARFNVSTVTIRKDLLALELQGRVVRAHGGAVAVEAGHSESAFAIRERLLPGEKDAIGRAAAASVLHGESIALDASTTALALARHLRRRGPWPHLTVITNGLRIATELAGSPGITVAMPAGFVRWEAMSLVGPLSDGMFDRINVQRAFMGAAGFTLETGLTDATEEEAHIKRLMVGAAKDVVAVVDHTKWGRAGFATFCPTERLTAVITDEGAPDAMVEALRARGIDVLSVPASDAPATAGEPAGSTVSGERRSDRRGRV